jgi:malonate decarboxylase beta subunit
MSALLQPQEANWYDASGRERIRGLLDAGSFTEFMGPAERCMSPHLAQFDLTGAFDDGIIVGCGALAGRPVFIAAQEGRFLGGAFGEVHGAKLVGLLRAACALRNAGGPGAVLLLLDTGGVRLQEANAGELAISEIINAIIDARRAGIAVVALIGGRAGAFGGGGIVTACCSRIVISRHGRISVSGPEVIETNKGVEEFDSKDRALVWRITGGRTRVLIGGADRYVGGRVMDFRQAAIALLDEPPPFTLATLTAEHQRLAERLIRYGSCRDAPEIWRKAGVTVAEQVADLPQESFLALPLLKEARHDAR